MTRARHCTSVTKVCYVSVDDPLISSLTVVSSLPAVSVYLCAHAQVCVGACMHARAHADLVITISDIQCLGWKLEYCRLVWLEHSTVQ